MQWLKAWVSLSHHDHSERINPSMPDTISDFELWYTLLNAVGAAFAVFLCIDVWGDIFDKRMMRGSVIRQQAARLCLCFAGLKTLIMVAIVALGIVAMTQPPPPRPDGTQGTTVTQIAAVIIFTLIPFCTVAVCVYWKHLRIQARKRGFAHSDMTIITGKTRGHGDV
jgi:quinol-cytochrome oxidoreductase complex cytochrome b subunit